MIEEFVNQIKKGSKIAIYGAGYAGLGLKKYIQENRKDICVHIFIDAYKEGDVDGIPIVDFKDIELVKNDIDLIICATKNSSFELTTVFNYLNIPNLCISENIQQYYRNEQISLKQRETSKIFQHEEDRKLYNLIWNARITNINDEIIEYVRKKHNISRNGQIRNYYTHYMEFINKNAIRTVIDGGFCNGVHSLAFKRNLQNIKKMYAFEPMYQNFKNEVYDKLIQKANFCEIIYKGLSEKDDELIFARNLKRPEASRIVNNEYEMRNGEIKEIIKVTSIDNFKAEKNIEKIDLIKMDIEGAELSALKGATNTIIKDRPQLAISIYHSAEDFITIPKYLNEKLKDYEFRLDHYSPKIYETVFYAIPKELLV